MRWTRGPYVVSDDKRRLNLTLIGQWLDQTYWAKDQPMSVLRRAVKHSLCLGLYRGRQQMGFARAVTDYATFTWICDVIVDPAHRGQGLGKWMVDCLVHHPKLQTRSQTLGTRDAHRLYTRFGFRRHEVLRRRPRPG